MNNTDIAQEFERFYSTLYNIDKSNASAPPPMSRTNKIKTFCSRVLSSDSVDSLKGAITEHKWNIVLKQLKSRKSPGPDGLPTAYYRLFVETLDFPFRRAFNSISTSNSLTQGILEAYIVVIPKDDKDHTQAANYRPISLLNVVISHDQVGFVPGCEARDNTIKAINLHHRITS